MPKAIKVSVYAVKHIEQDWALGDADGTISERDIALADIEQAVSDALEAVGFTGPVVDVEVVNG